MLGKLRKVLNVVRYGWLITGTTLLLFCGIEGIGYPLLLIRDARVASSQAVDFRVGSKQMPTQIPLGYISTGRNGKQPRL